MSPQADSHSSISPPFPREEKEEGHREQSGGCVMSEAARVSELKAAPKREY